MNKYIKENITIALFFFSTCFFAQEERNYCPFVEEGKVWTVAHNLIRQDYVYTDVFEIKGDTIIDDVACKKMYVNEFPDYHNVSGYLMALYEKDKKVFFLPKDDTEFMLMYDFGANEGDTIVVDYANVPFFAKMTYKNHYVVGDLDEKDGLRTHTVYDQDYKIYILNQGLDTISNEEIAFKWVEGIGTLKSPLMNVGVGAIGITSQVIDCQIDKRILFRDEDNMIIWQSLTPIRNLPSNQSRPTSNNLFDLSGRRLSAPPAKGFFIQDGQKVVR